MISKLLILIVVFLSSGISACGQLKDYKLVSKPPPPDYHLYTDPELEYYLSWYLRSAPDEGKLKYVSTVKFGVPSDGSMVRCQIIEMDKYRTRAEERKIIVRRPKAYDGTFTRNIMHEFAHCLHNKHHVDDPTAIMYETNVQSEEFWDEHIDEKMEGLFAQ